MPPENWFNQHFNSGNAPVRYLALRLGRQQKISRQRKAYGVDESVKSGGDQIDYEDELPQIHEEFEAALAKAGARCMMGAHHPLCAQR